MNTNKIDKWMLGFMLIGVIGALALAWPGKADSPHDQPLPTPPEYICIWVHFPGDYSPTVWNYNSSDDAIQIARGTPLSKALAYVGKFGYQIHQDGFNGQFIILKKP